MDKLQQLDQEVQTKEQEYLNCYKVKDISCDTCNMLMDNLKNYYDKKRSRILAEQNRWTQTEKD